MAFMNSDNGNNCIVNYPDAAVFLTTAKPSMALLETKNLFFNDLE